MTHDGFGLRLREAIRILIRRDRRAAIREAIPAITPEEVEEARRFFPRPKFFIFGHARSGTTLLARLVRLHRQVHCNWQSHFFTRAPFLTGLVESPQVAEWLGRRDNRWNRGRDLSPVVLRAVADFILEREAARQGKGIVGDKSPSSRLHGAAVERLAAVYPDARLIYIVRDGRDTLVSQRLQSFVDAVDTLSRDDLRLRRAFLESPDGFLAGGRSIFFEADLRRRAERWARNVTETVAAGKERFGDRFLQIRFEAVLAEPLSEVNRVWGFLGAADSSGDEEDAVRAEMALNPDAEWQRKQLGAAAVRIPKGGSGTWRGMMTAGDLAVVEQVAGPTLRAWGYAESVGQ